MEPPAVQFIDGIPVTQADIRLWLLTVPKLSPDGAYARYYAKNWDVAHKIARSKKQGAWPPFNPQTSDPEGEMLIFYSRGRVDAVLNLSTGEHMSLKEAVKRAAAGQLPWTRIVPCRQFRDRCRKRRCR